MRIIHQDLKSGIVKVEPDSPDDLWYLSLLIEPGDIVSGESERKVKIGDADTEKARVVRKKVFLSLKAEKVEFADGSLRVLGTITEGPDDIPLGAHHSFSIEQRERFTIQKNEWLSFQVDKLKEAATARPLSILVVVFDREEAIFGMLKTQGYELLSRMKGDVNKKGVEEKKAGNFSKDICRQLQEYDERYSVEHIVAASPAFWKEYLEKELPGPLKKKTVFATCSEVDASTINELIARPELKKVLEEDRTAREGALVEEFLTAIAKDKATYGIKDVRKKAEEGAIGTLLVAESYLHESREKGFYKDIDSIMRLVDKSKGKVHILSTHAAKKVIALGGIAGTLRWS
jgi:protein pelota